MAIKESDLYSALWASCDELRGGMDASQYKDYVLFMLFVKYIASKCGDSSDFAPPVHSRLEPLATKHTLDANLATVLLTT